MTIFASDYTDRALTGDSALIFKIINTIITVVPLLVITYVLGMLFKQTFKKFALSNFWLGLSFAIIWGIVIWMLVREFQSDTTEVVIGWEVPRQGNLVLTFTIDAGSGNFEIQQCNGCDPANSGDGTDNDEYSETIAVDSILNA